MVNDGLGWLLMVKFKTWTEGAIRQKTFGSFTRSDQCWRMNITYNLVMTNIAMENYPFIDDFPTKTTIYKGFSMANSSKIMVRHLLYLLYLLYLLW